MTTCWSQFIFTLLLKQGIERFLLLLVELHITEGENLAAGGVVQIEVTLSAQMEPSLTMVRSAFLNFYKISGSS